MASAKQVRVSVLTGDPRLPDSTKRDSRYNEEDFATQRAMRRELEALGAAGGGYRFEFADDHATLFERFAADPPDLVLNFCDTGFRNIASQELHVPALLEMLDVPCSGAPPACMAICYDKAIVRLVAEAHGVPVPREVYLDADAPLGELPPDPYPALIKPNQGDGSVGITEKAVVRTPDEARAYLRWLRAELPGRAALVQEYLPGPEYGVGLIGNPGAGGLRALPVLEVDFSNLPEGCTPILGFESKALPDSPYWTDIRYRQTSAGPDLTGPMVAHAELLFERLGCRDYARFDFRAAADGTPRLMEVNPNPAWAYDGKLALMAGFAGLAYGEMLRLILEAALRRVAAGGR